MSCYVTVSKHIGHIITIDVNERKDIFDAILFSGTHQNIYISLENNNCSDGSMEVLLSALKKN